MSRKISTYHADDGKGLVTVSLGKECFVLDYYDDRGHHFFAEEFDNYTVAQVEQIAEDWAMGYRQLERNLA